MIKKMKKVLKPKCLTIVLIILIICVIVTNYKTLYLDYYFKTIFPPYSVEEYYSNNWRDNPAEIFSYENAPILAAKIKVNSISLYLTKLFMRVEYDSSDDNVVESTYNRMNLPDWWIIDRNIKVEEIYTGYKHRKNFSIVDDNGKIVEVERMLAESNIYVVSEQDVKYMYIISLL